MIVEDMEGTRLDSYISSKTEYSRSKVQKLIKEGNITVNGKKENASYLVKLNDEIKIDDELDVDLSVEPENIPLDIIYEDQDVLVEH